MQDKAEEAYKLGRQIALDQLPCEAPIRSEISLSLSLFMYEVRKDKKYALKMLNSTFTEAMGILREVEGAQYKKLVLLIGVMKDHLSTWQQ